MLALFGQSREHQILLALSVGLFMGVAVPILAGSQRSVTPAYAQAAEKWLAGESMYGTTGHGFLYLPHSALIYIPFAVMPEPAGDLLWRAVSFGLLGLGAWHFFRLLPDNRPRFNLAAGFVVLLLSAESVRNGQATVLMTACMLLAADALAYARWNRATLLLAFAFAVKPLALVMILLAAALYRPMLWRLALAAVVLPLVPYAFQSPQYVTGQYHAFVESLRHVYRLGHEAWWAQLFGMLKVFGWDVPSPIQTGCRVLAAAATLAVCWLAQRRLEVRRFAVWLFTLTAIYVMLLNPRTENSTYCLLGPAIGVWYAEAGRRRNRGQWALLLTLSIAVVGSYEIGKFFTPAGAQPIWLAPLACTIFAGYAAVRLAGEMKATAKKDTAPLSTPEAALTPAALSRLARARR